MPHKDKTARKIWAANYRAKNRLVIRERLRMWRAKNKMKVTAYNRTWRQANKARQAAYFRAWRKLNPDKEAAKHRRWRARFPDRELAGRRRWRLNNPELSAAHRAARRARECEAAVPLTPAERLMIVALYARARSLSATNGEPYHVDHIRPLARGGLHHPSNLQILRGTDNQRKGAKWRG